MKERDLYPLVTKWLENFLKKRYPKAVTILAEDTSTTGVAQFLRRHDLLAFAPWGAMLHIPADVTGAALIRTKAQQMIKLAIVEVKVGVINLRDLSQALGYAKVVVPDHAFIISPKGWSAVLQKLVQNFERTDILEYAPNRFIVVARWDNLSKSVRPGDIMPPGRL